MGSHKGSGHGWNAEFPARIIPAACRPRAPRQQCVHRQILGFVPWACGRPRKPASSVTRTSWPEPPGGWREFAVRGRVCAPWPCRGSAGERQPRDRDPAPTSAPTSRPADSPDSGGGTDSGGARARGRVRAEPAAAASRAVRGSRRRRAVPGFASHRSPDQDGHAFPPAPGRAAKPRALRGAHPRAGDRRALVIDDAARDRRHEHDAPGREVVVHDYPPCLGGRRRSACRLLGGSRNVPSDCRAGEGPVVPARSVGQEAEACNRDRARGANGLGRWGARGAARRRRRGSVRGPGGGAAAGGFALGGASVAASYLRRVRAPGPGAAAAAGAIRAREQPAATSGEPDQAEDRERGDERLVIERAGAAGAAAARRPHALRTVATPSWW